MGKFSDSPLPGQTSCSSMSKKNLPNPYLPAPITTTPSTSTPPTSPEFKLNARPTPKLKSKPKPKPKPKSASKNSSHPSLHDPNPSETATLTPHGFPPITTPLQTKYIYLFFRFCAERHRMYDKRQEGIPRDQLSEDETLTRTFVGNIYRELDGGSFRVKELVIDKGEQTVEEVFFRILLFTAFYSEPTYQLLLTTLSHPPRYSTFTTDLPLYESTLLAQSKSSQPLYYSGFQIVPPTIHFGRPHYSASLRFVLSLMTADLPRRLAACTFATDASAILQSIPTIGGFNAQNLITLLNLSPLFKLQYRNHSSCGPGSRAYLKRIFGRVISNPTMEEAGLRWMYENQWRFWARLSGEGVTIPHAWTLGLRPGMRVLDIENSMCWCHRYINDFTTKGYGNLSQKGVPKWDEEVVSGVSAPAWCEEEKWVGSNSKVAWVGDWEELQLRKESELREGGEEVWEVEKIVARGKIGGARGKRLFRVRWSGFMPEEDTWEPEDELRKSASEALDDWLEWEKAIVASFERVRKEFPLEEQVVRAKDKQPVKGKKRGGVDVKTEEEASITSKKRKRTRRRESAREEDDLEEEDEEDEEDEEEEEEVTTPSTARQRTGRNVEQQVKVEDVSLDPEVKLEQEALNEGF